MQKIKLAVVLPSRGLIFSKTFEELLRELKPVNHKIFWAHGLPIPDCFNVPVNKALADEQVTHVLFCEDDMMLPKGILQKMIELNVPATALDYPFKANGDATMLHDPDGMAIYSGTGFLLVQRWVLDSMPKPIFKTDLAWDMMIRRDGTLEFWCIDVSKKKTYGLHDVQFGVTLWTNGIPIVPAANAGQRKLIALGKPTVNNGAHNIQEITEVGINNVTKNAKGADLEKYAAAISRVKTVKIRTEKPDDIIYINGLPQLVDEEFESI